MIFVIWITSREVSSHSVIQAANDCRCLYLIGNLLWGGCSTVALVGVFLIHSRGSFLVQYIGYELQSGVFLCPANSLLCFGSRLFPIDLWFICSIKQISLCLHVYMDTTSSKQWSSVQTIMHRSTVVFFPLFCDHLSCHTFPWLWHRANAQPLNSRTKQALIWERVAPKHVGYIQTSKTHYQFGHMLKNRNQFHSMVVTTGAHDAGSPDAL